MDLQVNGQRTYCYTGGKAFDPALPTVVFVHGGQLDHSVWALQSRYLAHHGHGVIAVDLPGHGRSAGEPCRSVESMSEWLAGVLSASGVTRAAVVGHSMGALVAVEFAARWPERVTRIALLGVAFPMRVSSELLAAARAEEARAQRMINVWSQASIAHYPSNPGPGAWVHGTNLRLMQRQRPGVLFADFNACNTYASGAEAASRVRCPVLVILGRRDSMTSVRSGREFASAFPDARLIELDGSGHNLMGERPDEVLDALRDFLA